MDRSLEDLRLEREQLKIQMATTKRQLKQERQKAKDAARSATRQWQLTPWLKKVIVTIYMLAQYRAAPAAKFLHVAAQRRRWPGKSDEELEKMVEDLFLHEDVDELGRMCDLEEQGDPRVTKEALKHVEEWRAVEYVRDLNSRLGIAPSTEDILRKLEENRLQLPLPLRPPSKGTAADVKARMWARRWRGRWGARYGKLRIREEVALADMRHKAVLQCRF